MFRPLIRRLSSPATLVASLALCVGLAGTGYAAVKLPANSVGAKQIKRDAVPDAARAGGIAFARVTAAGAVDQSVSQGIRVLQRIGATYCLDYTGGSVRNFQLTIDISGANSATSLVAGTAIAPLGPCPAGTDIAVGTANTSGAPQQLPFYVSVIA
jgi:hypothetical protein